MWGLGQGFNPWRTAFWRAAKTFLQNDHFFFIFVYVQDM